MELIVEEWGTFVRKHQGRLRVQKDKQVLQEVPLLHLEQVLIVRRRHRHLVGCDPRLLRAGHADSLLIVHRPCRGEPL